MPKGAENRLGLESWDLLDKNGPA